MKNSEQCSQFQYKHVIGVDPSGNFNEGKGTTGWCVYDTTVQQITVAGSISAKAHPSQEDYWHDHLLLLDYLVKQAGGSAVIVLEDYLLYADKAENQINSRMETSKLIGLIEHWCWTHNIHHVLQTAGLVKSRWSDDILVHKGILVPLNRGFAIPAAPTRAISRHSKDAIRHAVHYATFKNKEAHTWQTNKLLKKSSKQKAQKSLEESEIL